MKTPSPTSETHMPLHSRRKSRWRSGDSRRTRSRAGLSGMRAARLVGRGAQVLQRGVGVHRPGEQEALTQVAAELAQAGPLLLVLDALGDDLEVQRLAEADHRAR